jgi:putative endonuclease
MEKKYYIYIIGNAINTVLYIGVTSDLKKRINQHKNKTFNGFSNRYNCTKLLWYEQTENIFSALKKEKQLKKWNRLFKENLINKVNPNWKDLLNNII